MWYLGFVNVSILGFETFVLKHVFLESLCLFSFVKHSLKSIKWGIIVDCSSRLV